MADVDNRFRGGTCRPGEPAASWPGSDRLLLRGRRSLTLAIAAWPLARAARAQTQARYRIALLPDFSPAWEPLLKLFVSALAEFGHIEGRDYVFYRSGVYYGADADRAVNMVIDAQPDLIYAANLGYVIAAHRRTKTIPIVMWVSGFPVEGGVADSLAKPGKNVTGMAIYAGAQVFGKLVQLLLEVKPAIRRIAALCSYVPPFHPIEETRPVIEEMREAGGRLGVDLRVFEIARPDQVDHALAAAATDRAEALLLTSGAAMVPRRPEILRFAIDRRLPTISDADWDPPNELLLSYGANIAELMRPSATYVERVLWRGAKPGDLPIQLPAKFELVINPRMASAIGLQLPQAILLRADRTVG